MRDEVELTAQAGTLVMAPADRPRRGWDEAFASKALAGDHDLLDAALTTASRLYPTRIPTRFGAHAGHRRELQDVGSAVGRPSEDLVADVRLVAGCPLAAGQREPC